MRQIKGERVISSSRQKATGSNAHAELASAGSINSYRRSGRGLGTEVEGARRWGGGAEVGRGCRGGKGAWMAAGACGSFLPIAAMSPSEIKDVERTEGLK